MAGVQVLAAVGWRPDCGRGHRVNAEFGVARANCRDQLQVVEFADSFLRVSGDGFFQDWFGLSCASVALPASYPVVHTWILGLHPQRKPPFGLLQ